jgi:hypothetical protein
VLYSRRREKGEDVLTTKAHFKDTCLARGVTMEAKKTSHCEPNYRPRKVDATTIYIMTGYPPMYISTAGKRRPGTGMGPRPEWNRVPVSLSWRPAQLQASDTNHGNN